MSKFTPTNRSTPCPICGDTKGKCRTTASELVLCMTNAGNSHVSGWKHIGDAYDGLWGKFFPAGDRPQGFSSPKPKPPENNFPVINPAARDRAYREFLDSLTLAPDHREDLRRRGLTDEQIDRGGFVTLKPGDRNKIDGIATGTRHRGYLCPIRNADGRLLGCQIRLDEGNGGRYRWLKSSKISSHLPNGELPLQVAACVGKPQRIVTIEGPLKSWIVAQLWPGTIAIGASGGNFQGCKKQLQTALQKFPELPILFAPDAGSLANRHVRRRDTGTIKLLQSWGYDPQVLDWGQLYDKQVLDLDDWLATGGNPEDISQIDTDDYLAIVDTSWLQRLRDRLQNVRTTQHGPVLANVTGEAQLPAAPEQQAMQYAVGDRIETWQAIAGQGRIVADTSGTGSGKSYDAGRLEPETLGCERVMYVTSDPRNVTTETLKHGWKTVQGRHGGLTVNDRGQIRLWDGDPQKYATTAPNCSRPKTIAALRSMGISQADEASTICTTCPHFGACNHAKNGTYTYLNDRRKAIASTKRIIHPSALPDPEDYDYSQEIVIIEEAGEIINTTATLTVRASEIEKWFAALAEDMGDLLPQLRPLLSQLKEMLTGEAKAPTMHGWSHHQLVEQLKPLASGVIDLEAIARMVGPVDDILNPSKEYGMELADLPARLRKQLLDKDAEASQKVRDRVLQQFLMPLIEILRGGRGTLSLQRGALTISHGDNNLAEICRRAKAVILLDATAHVEQMAIALGVATTKIALVKQEEPEGAKLEIHQISGLGRNGSRRGGDQVRRADALVDTLRSQYENVGVIRWKKYVRDGEDAGYWFADSRGRNDFAECDALVLDGIPCLNVNALAAEFEALHGRVPTDTTETVRRSIQATNAPPGKQYILDSNESADPLFAEFVRRRILAEIHQAIGRLRANRRPGETLHVYILGDYAIDLPVEVVKAEEVTLEAARKSDRNMIGILRAAVDIVERGADITSAALAKAIDRSEQAIWKIAGKFGGMKTFRKTLLLLLAPYKAKVGNGDQATWEWLANEYLPLFQVDGGDAGLLEEVATSIETHGWDDWQRIADAFNPNVRKQVLVAFLRFAPQTWLDELIGGVQPLNRSLDSVACGCGVP